MTVFHLKYRPQKIADLDLAQVRSTLLKILTSDNLPQSFLFVGPKGAGKTSAARILARAVNCLKPEGGEPCGECNNCQEISKGASLDVMEMDAASNRGIDEARSLKDKAYLLPSKLKKKVFIIDEVHMMTRDAFNALLKLIEEPPAHTIFVLCTTDEEKIPDTVLSRLVKVSFSRGASDELKKSLRRVIEGEKIKIDETVIDVLVEKSDGSFRNLQRTFNEIVMDCGEEITMDSVQKYFQRKSGGYSMEEFEENLIMGDVRVILEKIEKMADEGVDFRLYRENLLRYFQEKLLGNLGVLNKLTSKMSVVELEKWLQLLIVAGKQEKDVGLEQLPLQLAVAEFLNGKSLNPSGLRPSPLDRGASKGEEKVEVKNEAKSSVNIGVEVEKIASDWGKVLMAVKPVNHSVEAFLRAARPKSISGNVVTLEVYYPFHKDRLEEQKNRKLVEDSLSQIVGAPVVLECVLGESGSKISEVIIQETSPVADEAVRQDMPKEKSGDDIYNMAKEIFG